MIVLFDTSVVVPALVDDHTHHPIAFPWVRRALKGEIRGVIASHAIAETYAILTTLPRQPRISPEHAKRLIESNVLRALRIIRLGASDYAAVIRSLASAGLSGGIVYDALHARAAVKAKADRLLTLNRRDFDRLARLFPVRVASP